MARPLRAILDGQDVTAHLDDALTFSMVDDRGCEAAGLSFPRRVSVRRGDSLRIDSGLETVWVGRVEDVARRGRTGTRVTGAGAAAVLTDAEVQEIYVDRDLAAWGDLSRTRRIELMGLTPPFYFPGESSVTPDPATGLPCITHRTDNLSSSQKGVLGINYYRSPVPIGAIYYDFASKDGTGTLNSDFQKQLQLVTVDSGAGSFFGTGNLSGAGAAGYLATNGQTYRFAYIETYRNTALFAGSGVDWAAFWRKLAVYGDHGLTRRGPDPGGFYDADILLDVLRRAGFAAGDVEADTTFIIPHFTVPTPRGSLDVIGELARFTGKPYGAWPRRGVRGGDPVFDFKPAPTSPTAWVSRDDLAAEPEFTEQLADLYNRVRVTYEDPARGAGTVTRTRTVPELDELGLTRTLPVDLGPGTEATAQTYGDFVLALSQRRGRGAGSLELVRDVRGPAGPRPAYHLRPGQDLLRVTDLPGLGPFANDGRGDFQIRRLEVSAGREGVRTTLELGSGADLTEVLNARLALSDYRLTGAAGGSSTTD